MKITLALLTLALALTGLGGCKSQAEKDAELDAVIKQAESANQAVLNGLDERLTDAIIRSIELRQGEDVSNRFTLDCNRRGYKLSKDDKPDAAGYSAIIGLAGGSQSPRLKAECDAIIARENHIESREAARDKAEEARKDAAYLKAHPQK